MLGDITRRHGLLKKEMHAIARDRLRDDALLLPQFSMGYVFGLETNRRQATQWRDTQVHGKVAEVTAMNRRWCRRAA